MPNFTETVSVQEEYLHGIDGGEPTASRDDSVVKQQCLCVVRQVNLTAINSLGNIFNSAIRSR